MSERFQFAGIAAMLPLLMVLGFGFELAEIGWFKAALAIAGVAGLALFAICWRVGRVFDRL